MKTATKQQNENKNVQNSKNEEKGAIMVVSVPKHDFQNSPEPEKLDQDKEQKTETIKAVIETFAPSAEERIKRAGNFQILTGKYTHLKMKEEELEKFILSSDGQKEKLVLENSAGLKIEVNNSTVLKEVVTVMKDRLNSLLTETENEVKNFVI